MPPSTFRDDPVAQASDRFRNVLGRSLIYASPVSAALVAWSLRTLVGKVGFSFASEPLIVLGNLAIAVLGSAAGVALLRGRLSVKIAGSLAYGVLSFFIYVIAVAVLFRLR